MSKIECRIEFDVDTTTGEPVSNFLGRFSIGNHGGRLFLKPDGKTVLLIEKEAIEDGSIVLLHDFGEAVMCVPSCGRR